MCGLCVQNAAVPSASHRIEANFCFVVNKKKIVINAIYRLAIPAP